MRYFLILVLLPLTSHAQSQIQAYSTENILGVWEVSSLELNGFTSFGSEFSRKRGEVYTLIFNKQGYVKNQTTQSIYNYEVLKEGTLKIYKTKTYRYGNQVKDKNHYDLWQISGSYENCYQAKVVKKKMTGYYQKEGYKWCKVQDFPKPVTTSPNYNFK